jgi:hypothetical protein
MLVHSFHWFKNGSLYTERGSGGRFCDGYIFVTKVPSRPSSFVEIILVMISTQFLSMLGVYICLDQTLLFLTIEAVYRRHHRQHAFW